MAEYKQPLCYQCERPLLHDEIALFCRLVSRGADRYLCLSCLARSYGVTEEQLQTKIKLFKEMGCSLF